MNILSLPNELVQIIFDYLDTVSQIRLKLVCKNFSTFTLTNLLSFPDKITDEVLAKNPSVKFLDLFGNTKVTSVDNLYSLLSLNIADSLIKKGTFQQSKTLRKLYIDPNNPITARAQIIYCPDYKYFNISTSTINWLNNIINTKSSISPKIFSFLQTIDVDKEPDKIVACFLIWAKKFNCNTNCDLWKWLSRYTNIRNRGHKTVLMVACGSCNLIGTINCVSSLIKLGADVNAADDFGIDCLMICARHCCTDLDIECAKMLINTKINTRRKNLLGETALMIASTNCNLPTSPKMIELLLKSGANPKSRDMNGYSALMHAISSATTIYAIECIRLLITADESEINSINGFGKTVLVLACGCANNDHFVEIIKLLLERGASCEIIGMKLMSPLLTICYNVYDFDSVSIIKLLIPQHNLAHTNDNGATLLMLACAACYCQYHLLRVKYLLEVCPVEIKNAVDIDGCSCLDYAIRNCQSDQSLDCVKLLVSHGIKSGSLTGKFMWNNFVSSLEIPGESFKCFKFLSKHYDFGAKDRSGQSLIECLIGCKRIDKSVALKYVEYVVGRIGLDKLSNNDHELYKLHQFNYCSDLNWRN